jgi:Flp pilus assembly protein TadD
VSSTFSEPIAFAVECHQKGQFAEAERAYRDLLCQNPDNPDALHLLGMLAHDTGQPSKALELITRAVRLRPDISYYHSNLGNVLQQLERFQDAEHSYREALRLEPRLAEAHNNLGNALRALQRVPEAIASFLEAVKWKPEYHQAFGNLADLLLEQQRWEEAAVCYREARRIAPGWTPYTSGLVSALDKWGEQLRERGEYARAVACYQGALALSPRDPNLHLSLAHALLITGQFEPGWLEFEWRWLVKDCPIVSFPQPLWDGSPLAGKRILLWAEQGLGDTIQFVRFAELVKEAGGTVVLECQPPLARLLRTCPWIDEPIPYGEPLPDFDVHAPLQSLPRILRTTLGTIPAHVPYLSADADLVRSWKERLATCRGLRTGLVWAGNPHNRYDPQRSIPKERLETLMRTPGVDWFSLQKEDLPGDFSDAAALIANLDLVISVDTAAAHLAGALAKPVWTLLPFAPDFRWLMELEHSPWYPSMRLFRQPAAGDWDSVLTRVRQALEDFRDEHRR